MKSFAWLGVYAVAVVALFAAIAMAQPVSVESVKTLTKDAKGNWVEPTPKENGTLIKVSEYIYTVGEGKDKKELKSGIKEWSEFDKQPVQPNVKSPLPANVCPMCGPACKCGPCECTDDHWTFNCAAADPVRKAAVIRQMQYRFQQQPKPLTQPVSYVQPSQPRSVAAARPFRLSDSPNRHYECEYDASHVCAKCGTTQLVIAHFNADRTHTHTCPQCGHSWRHKS